MSEFNTSKTNSEYAFIRPFLYKKASMTTISTRMLILLGVQVILLALTKSYNALYVIGASFAGALFSFLFRFFVSKDFGYSAFIVLLQGLLIGMLLPETYPPFAAFLLTFTLFLVVRYIFDNSFNVWVNIVAFGVVIAWFIGKRFFPSFIITSDLIGTKNPSLALIQKGFFPSGVYDTSATYFLNNMIFKLFNVSIPNGYVSLMWDTHSAIPAFRFNIVTIISSLFLFSDDGVESTIPVIFILVYAVLVRLFAPVVFGGSLNTGDIILALFTSGTLFCSVFIMQWFGTVPGSLIGKIIYAVATGIIAFLVVGCGTSSCGMVFTILISNILTVIIKGIEDKKKLLSLQKIISAREEVNPK